MADTFNCPSCGAPLDYEGGSERTIRCPFCDNSVIVPENLLTKPPAPRRKPPAQMAEPPQPAASPWGSYLLLAGIFAFVLAMIFIPIYASHQAKKVIAEAPYQSPVRSLPDVPHATAAPKGIPQVTEALRESQVTQTAAVLERTATAEARQQSATAQALQQTATAETLQQTATAVWQATATYGMGVQVKAETWRVALQEKFKNAAGGWQVGNNQNQYYTGSRTIANGIYRWQLTSRQNFLTNEYPLTRSYSDFYAGVDVRIVQGPEKEANYGLVFRSASDDSAWYFFAIDGSGNYALMFFAGPTPDYVVDWTHSPDLEAEGINRLSVAAQGKHIVLYINDRPVAAFDDTRLDKGQVGLSLLMTSLGDTATVEFSNFEVRTP